MKNNFVFVFYLHGVVCVAATAKQYFFSETWRMNVVVIGSKNIISFSWSRRGECSIEMKKYIFLL